MKTYFAYARVSTVKQGEHGSSLTEQHSAIDAYAARHGLPISQWFEEMETAAKQGRREFTRMMTELHRGKAAGVIIHKIDRSARNLKDWSQISDLMDAGIEVHFAHESLDMGTRGGRLAADIQAVVAADFIRNLRDEVRKGFYGRLKQGFYPLQAPRGYLNRGRAKAKEIDPVLGPLVRQAFELYGSGNYGLETLRAEMALRGLRSKAGKPLALEPTSRMLRNPFYIGLMRIDVTGQVFAGNHEPLVTKKLFDRVQAILAGRLYPRVEKNRFLFRRLIKCARCGRSLTGERQKGRIYYRCHDLGCFGVCVSETNIDIFVRQQLALLEVEEGEIGDFRDILRHQIEIGDVGAEDRIAGIKRDVGLIDERLIRLTDAILDDTIDKVAYDERKIALINQRIALQDRLRESDKLTQSRMMAERFELGFAALQGYIRGNDDEKREVVKIVCSNMLSDRKKLLLPMDWPFEHMRTWSISQSCEPYQGTDRISSLAKRHESMRELIQNIVDDAPGEPLSTPSERPQERREARDQCC